MRPTARQIEMIKLMAEGLGDKEIAVKLHLSPYSVKGTLRLAYKRCGAVNRCHIVATGFREGWLC